jgi:hypothetical protein
VLELFQNNAQLADFLKHPDPGLKNRHRKIGRHETGVVLRDVQRFADKAEIPGLGPEEPAARLNLSRMSSSWVMKSWKMLSPTSGSGWIVPWGAEFMSISVFFFVSAIINSF